MVVCCGCFDIFYLCQGQKFVTPKQVCKGSESFHQSLLAVWNDNFSVVKYLVNQKADLNLKTKDTIGSSKI